MLEVLRERNFRFLWLGQATSAFGSSLVPVALAFAVIDLTGSPSALGLVLSAGLVSHVWQLLVLFALFGAGDAFFSPASTGLVPATVPPTHLQQANSLMGIGRDAA